jgi:hypothetical protein
MSAFGDPKKMPGGYSIETSLGDSTSYLPIPLRFLRSVEMNGQTGVKGSIMINPQAPCCCGLCGWCGVSYYPYKYINVYINQSIFITTYKQRINYKKYKLILIWLN